MNTMEYQKDWLALMAPLKLNEETKDITSGWEIHFHVPEGKELFWKQKFEQTEFVEWAELRACLN